MFGKGSLGPGIRKETSPSAQFLIQELRKKALNTAFLLSLPPGLPRGLSKLDPINFLPWGNSDLP